MKLRHWNVRTGKTYGYMTDEAADEPYGTTETTDTIFPPKRSGCPVACC